MSNNLALNIEQIKKDKDGLDVLSDIYIYAVLGERVSASDLIRFKWYGVHQQEDTNNYFRVKIPLSLGQLNLEQVKTLSAISKEYAKDSLDFTKDQKVELKWIKINDLPHVFNLLHNVNLNTIFESGHTVRNIITCSVNGVDHDQVADVSELANKLNDSFIGNKNFSNLPNKLQMAISGCSSNCTSNSKQDVNFDAIKNEKDKVLFSVKIVGNHIGFVTPSQVVPIARAIAKVYRDYGNRDDVQTSSFESLIASWGVDKFIDLLSSSITFKIKNITLEDEKETPYTEHFGINESKEKGKSYIGCKVNSLEVGSSGFDNLASLLEKYEASKIKITTSGNIIILDAPTLNAEKFAKDLQKVNFNPFV